VFVLGNTTWQVTRVQRNRVYVRDVYGAAPTVPAWSGERPSRTFDVGTLVGQLRERMGQLLADRARDTCTDRAILSELRKDYYLDTDGAQAILTYFSEQYALMGMLPSHRRIVVESFIDQMGHQQVIIHSVFGIRVNDALMPALQNALRRRHGFEVRGAADDDGVLLTPPENERIRPHELMGLLTPASFSDLVNEAIVSSAVFASRFRHNAVRAMMVLREYRGRKTPVWAQNFRAAAILGHVGEDHQFPTVKETLRECRCEALDVPGAECVVGQIARGEITVEVHQTKAPSPFTHALLLVGQYGDFGGISDKQRHARLMHLHRDVLKQLLSEDELKALLHQEVIEDFVAKRQHIDPGARARDENELVGILSECGGFSVREDSDHSVFDRVQGDAEWMLSKLWRGRRIMQIPVGTDIYWIATHEFPMFCDAMKQPVRLAEVDRQVLAGLQKRKQHTADELSSQLGISRSDVAASLAKLERAFLVVRAGTAKAEVRWARTERWFPSGVA